MSELPTVFISYAYGENKHEDWVKHLVSCLKGYGRMRIIFDQDDIYPGDLLDIFMEQGITNADMIVAICSQDYTEKADAREGGVGYENIILTKKIMAEKSIDVTKIIPVIRNNPTKKTPICFGSRKYIDFENDNDFDSNVKNLVTSILRDRNQSESALESEEMSWIEKKVRNARFEFFESEGYDNLESTKNDLLTAIEDNFVFNGHDLREYKYTMCNDSITAECVENEQIIYLALEPETCGGYGVITAKKAFDLIFERLKKNSNEKWIFAAEASGYTRAPLAVVVYGEKFRKPHDRKVDGIYETWRNQIYDKSPWKVE